MTTPASPRKRDSPQGAAAAFQEMAARLGADEVAIVRNPGYLFQPYEIYALAPRRTSLRRLAAAVMDMDGTTTTTETLCLHSLETMVRRATGRLESAEWDGLDREQDYPHIIGNSTTRHVEYLVDTYGDAFSETRFPVGFLWAASWTLVHGRDPGRRLEVEADMAALGMSSLVRDPAFLELADLPEPVGAERAVRLLPGDRVTALRDPVNRVRAAVDIYYARYHEILAQLAQGRAEDVAREILGDASAAVIDPMPGIPVFLPLLKGWFGRPEDAEALAPVLCPDPERHASAREALTLLGKRFAAAPARVAVVTSSIAYEAEIVLAEVFRSIRLQIEQWPVRDELRATLLQRFAAPSAYYDAVVTASDSSEIRLKPHRDLYALALHRLGMPRSRFGEVVGFEDSESGVVAIRAAGIGLAVGVPFSDTAGHDLSAASIIVRGGLPEVITDHHCFLSR